MGSVGYHLSIDAHDSNRALIQERCNVINFLCELSVAIDLCPVQEPWIYKLDPCEPEWDGFSAVQLGKVSRVALHFVNSLGAVHLDLFSLREFDITEVKTVLQNYFKPQSMDINFFTRHVT